MIFDARLLPIFSLVIISACGGATAPRVVHPIENHPISIDDFAATYTLHLTLSPKPKLDVGLTLTVDAPTLVVGCDAWGGVEHCENEIGNVRALDEMHRALPVRQSSATWSIDAPRGSRVTIAYTVTPSKSDAMTEEKTKNYPIITNRYLHFIGHVALLTPHESDANEKRIALHWRGFHEAGWSVACSFGTGEDLALRLRYSELAHSVFVAGDYEIIAAQPKTSLVTLAIRPGTWKFGPQDLLSTALPIIDEERRLFHDAPEPLLIVATPLSVDADFIHGTVFTGSIATFFPRAGRLLSAPLLGLLIAHEYFHHWDTLVMRPSEDEGAGIMWFTEGFAEFYMRRIAYRAGRISRNDYLLYLNRALAEYAASPAKNAPNEMIRAQFWNDDAVFRMPYVRGEIIALMLDVEIRNTSGGSKNLDDFVRLLADDVKLSGIGVTSETVLKKIANFTSAAFEARIRKIVTNGETATIPEDALAPCAMLKSAPTPQFDFTPAGQTSCATVL